jgi:hypothetical protein
LGARLVIVVDTPEDFDAVCGEVVIHAAVNGLEVRQDGGLFTQELKVLSVEGLSTMAANEQGLSGPAIRVIVAQRGSE